MGGKRTLRQHRDSDWPEYMRSAEDKIATSCVWILFAALCVHNLEEALTYAHFRERSADLVGRLLGYDLSLPSPMVFFLALVAVTASGGAISIWVGRSPFGAAKRAAVYGFAAILLVNVFIPHVPAAFLLGGYAPGVLTAVLINIPVALIVFWRMRGRT